MNNNFIYEEKVSPSWHRTQFEVTIRRASLTPHKRQSHADLQQLKVKLLQPILDHIENPDLCQRIRLAANEALALAWNKPSPFQFFPYLLEQKVREVHQWFRRQQQILLSTQVSVA